MRCRLLVGVGLAWVCVCAGARTAPADGAVPTEELLRQLGSKTSAAAEASLVERGRVGLLVAAENLDQIAGDEAWAGFARYLLRLAEGDGGDVFGELFKRRGSWPRASRGRLMEALRPLHALRPAAKPREFPLKRGTLSDPYRIPRVLLQRLENGASVTEGPLRGFHVDARSKGLTLTGPARKRVRGGRAGLVGVTMHGRTEQMLLFQCYDDWYAAPAVVYSGKSRGDSLTVLDADMDSVPGTAGDYVRWGGGGFVPVKENLLALSRGRFFWWSVHAKSRRFIARVTPADELGTPAQVRALAACNEWRAQLGLRPVMTDPVRMQECEERLVILERDGPTVVSSWRQEPSGFGRESILAFEPTARRGLVEMFSSAVSRFCLLAGAARWIGVAEADAASVDELPGYVVFWGGSGVQFPDVEHVLVPGPGQQDVPVRAKEEDQAPVGVPELFERRRGFPITITIPGASGARSIRNTHLEVRDLRSRESVACYVFTPEEPWHAAAKHNYMSVIGVPRKPLAADTDHAVRFTATVGDESVRWAWRFRTR